MRFNLAFKGLMSVLDYSEKGGSIIILTGVIYIQMYTASYTRRRGYSMTVVVLFTPSVGGEVKPSVPCLRFTACKRSLNGVEVVI